MSTKKNPPYCYGKLNEVFPMADNGLRMTPESCFPCYFKTECLREALSGKKGLELEEEMVDRAYEAGMISFLARWSKKKQIKRRLAQHKPEKNKKEEP